MSDSITIKNLEVWTHIGVSDEERANLQKLHITLIFKVNHVQTAAAYDDIELCPNYFDIAQYVKEIASEKPRKLIETLAEVISQKVLKKFQLKKLEIEIRKFIMPDTEWVSIEIERKSKKQRVKPAQD